MKKIIFRADANPIVGMGHFIRSLALAEILNKHFHCVFAIQEPTEYQIQEIEKTCHKWISLPTCRSHFQNFLSYLSGDEIVVLDNYYFDTNYQIAIKSKKCKLVCISDTYNIHYVADLVINHAPEINKNKYSCEPYTKLCLGLNYVLIRSEFIKSCESRKELTENAILLYIGAITNKKILNDILNILTIQEEIENIYLIHNNINDIKNNANPKLEVFKNLSANEILHLMNKAIIGIFPASTIAFEAIAARLPFITGYTAENQYNVYNGLVKNNLAIGVSDFNILNVRLLISSIKKLISSSVKRNLIIKHQIEAISKRSPQKLLEIFHEISKSE